jgi:hypothetical protein
MGFVKMVLAALTLVVGSIGWAREVDLPKLPIRDTRAPIAEQVQNPWVRVVGTLHLPNKRIKLPCLQETIVVCEDGQTFVLRGGSKEFQGQLRDLDGKRVLLSGKLDKGGVLLGDSVRAAEKDDKAGVTLTLTGKLNYAEGKSLPPVESWTITVDGQTFSLSFDKALKAEAKKLKGLSVIVTGTLLKDGTVKVTHLTDARLALAC